MILMGLIVLEAGSVVSFRMQVRGSHFSQKAREMGHPRVPLSAAHNSGNHAQETSRTFSGLGFDATVHVLKANPYMSERPIRR